MTFLNALKPLLRGQSAVTLRLSANADGGFRLIVTPALQGIDAGFDHFGAYDETRVVMLFAGDLSADRVQGRVMDFPLLLRKMRIVGDRSLGFFQVLFRPIARHIGLHVPA